MLERELVVDLDPGSTVDDLVIRLEEDIKARHGITQNILRSDFTVLVNGRHIDSLHERGLKDGDLVTILSPIGGG